MKSTAKRKYPLPDSFESVREAGAFWDKHSLADYQDDLKPIPFTAQIKRRHFEIEIDEESFLILRRRALKQRKPVKQIASKILKENLGAS
ncbi:MAG: CopG family antitoxin [Candidatus Sumerlaeaceae bacterium]